VNVVIQNCSDHFLSIDQAETVNKKTAGLFKIRTLLFGNNSSFSTRGKVVSSDKSKRWEFSRLKLLLAFLFLLASEIPTPFC